MRLTYIGKNYSICLKNLEWPESNLNLELKITKNLNG